MAKTKELSIGEKMEYKGQPVTVIGDGLKQPRGTVNVRNRFGYVEAVKAKDLKSLAED